MSMADADRNLLFGFLALQNDLISREELIAAVGLWLTEKSKPLDQILLERGALPSSQHQLLQALVAVHVQKHAGDPQQSLAALSSVSASVRQQLVQLGDTDVEQTLTCVSSGEKASNPDTNIVPREASSRFRVLRPHAKGGLGEVFVARDEELNREVALKEIQRDKAHKPDSRSRFVLEAEITGSLEHPGVVPVYGLGHYADGRPFYAMRFVHGDSLKQAVDRFHQSAETNNGDRNLQLRNLLGRFVDVCHAIEYAHSRGVLHRDLKPGNIMLGKYGETLVVDWGLAKATGRDDEAKVDGETTLQPVSSSGSAETQLGSAIGTPAYMSPEQAAGRLDELGRENDIYSLGATLYCVLTGRPPFIDVKAQDLLLKIQCGDFPNPRSVQPDVPPPLEAICLKCMAAKPQDRYAWPQQLADDVERFLADEPVASHHEPASIKVRRWLRKRPRSVAAMGASLLVGLSCAVVIAVVVFGKNQELAHTNRNLDDSNRQLDQANVDLRTSFAAERHAKAAADKQRDRARTAEQLAKNNETKARTQEAAASRSAAESEAVLEFLKTEVLSARPEGREGGVGVDVTVREMIDAAQPKIGDSFADQPLVEASVRDTLGTTYKHLGEFSPAIQQYERARELREEHLGSGHEDTIMTMINLSNAYRWAGKVNLALPLAEHVVKLSTRELGTHHERTFHARNCLASAYHSARRWDDALPLFEQTLKLSSEKLGPDHADTLYFMRNLAFAYNSAGKSEQALPVAERALKLHEAKFGPEHVDTIASMNALTMVYKSTSRLDKALPLAEKTVQLCRVKFGPKHYKTVSTMLTLANVYRDTGKLNHAVSLYEESLDAYRETLGPMHPYTLTATLSLATAYKSVGKPDQALPLYEETLRVRKELLGPEHLDTLSAMNDLSHAYATGGKWEQALPMAEEALKTRKSKLGPNDKYTIQSMNNLAIVYKAADQLDKALPLYEQALDAYTETLGPNHSYTLTATKNLAGGYLSAKQSDKAAPLYLRYIAGHRAKLQPNDPVLAARLATVGRELIEHKQFLTAESYLRESVAIREIKLPDDWRFFHVQSLLGAALAGQGYESQTDNKTVSLKKFEEAEPLLITGYEGMKQREATISIASKIRLTQAHKRIVEFYAAWEKPEEAAKWKANFDAAHTEKNNDDTPDL